MKHCNFLHLLVMGCALFAPYHLTAHEASEPNLASGKARVYDYAAPGATASGPADLIIYNANVVTVDARFSTAKAIAIKDDKILAVGNWQLEKYQGPDTKMIDARANTILPGLYDSHVHSYKAAISSLEDPQPVIDSIAAAQDFIRQQVAARPPKSWIILQRLYPTRMKEGRFPTRAELDEAAPNNPVYWNSGPVSIVNSKAIEVSQLAGAGNPPNGEIVRDAKHRPTGLLRNAANLLKLPPPVHPPTSKQIREAVMHLHQLYNQQGITSIGERRTYPESIDLFRDLEKTGELTVRVNCTRLMDDIGATLDDAITNLDAITNSGRGKLPYGPTGVGDDWVRIGPLKVFLDGGILVGTAYMRHPWGIGPTYQITEPAYRGQLNCDPVLLGELYEEAARRGWQLTAHCTGDAALDTLLNIYQRIQFKQDIRERRFLATHANFQTAQDWEKCQKLNIAADVQPIWLYKDGDSLMKTLGEKRMTNFLPFKTWLDKGLIIGGGSDHMVGTDSFEATNPWNPWLGMWIALTRQTGHGQVLLPKEKLTREEAIRFYTINNCYLNFEEKKKGSLEPGKFADLIMIDKDILKCPVDEIRHTKVLMTIVGGKTVWEAVKK
ncbi:MAG TPA: amidohydrolase [Candidatus Cybelea sp.]|jgi:predicted amidohydrolase YtcJ|nr:amidohydrolase [Candidatus Cybelea sp.]